MLVGDVVFRLKANSNLHFAQCFLRCHRPSSIQCSTVPGAYRVVHAQRNSRDGLIHGTVKEAPSRHDCRRRIGNRPTNGYGEGFFMLFLNPVVSAGNR